MARTRLVGDAVTLLSPEDEGGHILEALERVAKGQRVDRRHLRHRRKNGEEVVVSLSLAPVRDEDGVVGACAVVSDSTERMHEAENKYRALTEALPLVTLISAPNDRNSVAYASPQVETLLGYSPAEWQDDPELFSKLLHPEDRDEVLADAKKQTAGAAPGRAEYRMLARGGGVVWVREEVTTIRGPEGKPLYTQTLLIDIGERKRADEERERLLSAERDATARTVERQRRLDVVREAGQILASSLDYRSAIQRVAELAVRDYADWCVVDIIEDGSPLKRVAMARAEVLSQQTNVAPDQEPEEAVRAVVETGALQIVPALGETSKRPKKGAILGGVTARSAICVPLRARKRTLGALTLARTESSDAYGADDLALVEDFAGRIAIAFDRGAPLSRGRATSGRVARARPCRRRHAAARSEPESSASGIQLRSDHRDQGGRHRRSRGGRGHSRVAGNRGSSPGVDVGRSRTERGRRADRDGARGALARDLGRPVLRRDGLCLP